MVFKMEILLLWRNLFFCMILLIFCSVLQVTINTLLSFGKITDNVETWTAVVRIFLDPNLMMVDSGGQNIVGKHEKIVILYAWFVSHYRRKH
jgi:hypothetical protein